MAGVGANDEACNWVSDARYRCKRGICIPDFCFTSLGMVAVSIVVEQVSRSSRVLFSVCVKRAQSRLPDKAARTRHVIFVSGSKPISDVREQLSLFNQEKRRWKVCHRTPQWLLQRVIWSNL